MTTAINVDQTTTLTADKAGEDYIVNARLETAGIAIDASAAVAGRTFTVNGTVSSVSGPALRVGGTLVDSATILKVSDVGRFLSDGAGLIATSGGVDVENVGLFEAELTAIEFKGDYNTIVNTSAGDSHGTLSSRSGSAIVTSGRQDDILNTGSAVISAAGDAIVASGVKTSIRNEGTATIASADGSAIVTSGKKTYILSNSLIEAKADAIVMTGAGSTVELSGNGALQSTDARGIVLRGKDMTLVLKSETATVTAASDGVFSTGRNASITNGTTIASAEGAAIHAAGQSAGITNNATLDGAAYGILSTGNKARITNAGDIAADGIGIAIAGDKSVVVTKAHINAATALSIEGDGTKVTIENEIRGLSGTEAAIEISSAGRTTIVNKGAIHAQSGVAIEAGKGVDIVRNTGSIHGDVVLGAGKDVFTALKGEVTGSIAGGKGNDLYILGIPADIVEKSGGGIDTVRSKFSFTLAANIENLELLGKGPMEATGNGLANTITGNKGDNRLTGLGGRDVFVFEKGCGADIITDFTDGKDRIDLSDYAGIGRFADIARKIAMIGDHVVITLSGDDRITLENFDKSHLSGADFLF